MRKYHESDFPDKEYDEFYQDHFFQPVSDDDALNAHRIFPRVAWALDIAKDVQPEMILDLGCLEGYAAMTLLKHVPSVKSAFGVDLSKDGIELANARVKKYRLNAHFQQEAIESWMERWVDTENPKFDLIMAFEVMEHVKDPESVFNLIDRVLAPGGTVLISTPAFESPTFGKDDEQNKCHVRLYTLKDEDYKEENKYGTLRTATSLPKQLGKKRKIVSQEIFSELIHLRYAVK